MNGIKRIDLNGRTTAELIQILHQQYDGLWDMLDGIIGGEYKGEWKADIPYKLNDRVFQIESRLNDSDLLYIAQVKAVGDSGIVLGVAPNTPNSQFWNVLAITTTIEGPEGDVGPQGPKGDVGPQGPPGPKGDEGILTFTTFLNNSEILNIKTFLLTKGFDITTMPIRSFLRIQSASQATAAGFILGKNGTSVNSNILRRLECLTIGTTAYNQFVLTNVDFVNIAYSNSGNFTWDEMTITGNTPSPAVHIMINIILP